MRSGQIAAWVVERIYDCLFASAVFGVRGERGSGSGVHTGTALSVVHTGVALRVAGVIALGAAVGLGLLLAMKYRTEHIRRWITRNAGVPDGAPF